jgi:hypothetical protein
MYKKIHESEYGESPLNFHVDKRGAEVHVTLTYPPWTDADNKNDQCRYVCVDQEAVRASDGVRLYYDYQRDGFVVEQPRPYMKLIDGCYHCEQTWIEVGFFESWKFDRPEAEQMTEAENNAAAGQGVRE